MANAQNRLAPTDRKHSKVNGQHKHGSLGRQSPQELPCSIEAEQALLGIIIDDSTCFNNIRAVVTQEDFYDSSHKAIFAAIEELLDRNSLVDPITIDNHLTNQGGEQDLPFLVELKMNAESTTNAVFYAEVVKEKAIERQLLLAANKISKIAVEKGDVHEKIDRCREVLAETAETDRTASSPSLRVVSLGEFLSSDIPPRKYLLEPWLPFQGLALVYAWRGIGKTYLALSIGYAVASGGRMFGGWEAPSPNGVLLIDGEMPAVVLQERLAQIVEASDKPSVAPFNIITPDFQEGIMPDLSSRQGQEMINPHLDGISLIIVDNISTLCRGKENEAESWIAVQEWALKMRASGRSVLFIHHAGKGGAQRGTSKREDILDTVITLKRPKDYDPAQGAVFEVHFEKSRGFCGADADPFESKLITTPNGGVSWAVKSLEQSTYQKVVDLANEGLSQKNISDELELNKSTVCRHFKNAKEEGLITSQNGARGDHHG